MKQTCCFLFAIMLLSCNELTRQAKSKPVVVNAPVSAPTIIDPKDSTYLKIKLSKGAYTISLLDSALTTTNTALLEKFILNNKEWIDKNKVAVWNTENLPEFENIKVVLKKYDIISFFINTQ